MNVTPLGGGDCWLNGQVCKSATIDWTLRDGARAKMRVTVKRILNKYDYWLPRCRRSVGLRPVLRTACLSRPAPSARHTCREKPSKPCSCKPDCSAPNGPLSQPGSPVDVITWVLTLAACPTKSKPARSAKQHLQQYDASAEASEIIARHVSEEDGGIA